MKVPEVLDASLVGTTRRPRKQGAATSGMPSLNTGCGATRSAELRTRLMEATITTLLPRTKRLEPARRRLQAPSPHLPWYFNSNTSTRPCPANTVTSGKDESQNGRSNSFRDPGEPLTRSPTSWLPTLHRIVLKFSEVPSNNHRETCRRWGALVGHNRPVTNDSYRGVRLRPP